MDEGIAVIMAAVLATLGIIYASRQQRKLLRRQHTYQAIERHNRWVEFDEHLDSVKKMTDSDNIPSLETENRLKDIESIDFILNYYEFLSAAIWCGDIDEALVRECENGRLRRTVQKLGNYIKQNQKKFDDPTLWENLIQLHERWIIHPKGVLNTYDSIIEALVGRPLQHPIYRKFWEQD